MAIDRRAFGKSLIGAGLAAGTLPAQEESGKPKAKEPPAIPATVTKLFKSPEIHPNDLEAAPDGLWIGDQVSEVVNKVDWKTGMMLASLQTEAHNTSGLAVGGGYLWIGCNGGVSNRRPARANDRPVAEILQADMKTGKTVKWHRPPWATGIHGITWVEETGTLWVVSPSLGIVTEMDPKDMRIVHIIPAKGDRPHGLDWHDGKLWIVISGDRTIQQLDAKTGKVLETLKIGEKDPDPHGLCVHEGNLYYCDAGLTATSPGTAAGSICRIDLT
jgi:streptogramin lyase